MQKNVFKELPYILCHWKSIFFHFVITLKITMSVTLWTFIDEYTYIYYALSFLQDWCKIVPQRKSVFGRDFNVLLLVITVWCREKRLMIDIFPIIHKECHNSQQYVRHHDNNLIIWLISFYSYILMIRMIKS